MMTDKNIRNTPVSLRLPKVLKDNIAEIAKKKDTSLNEVSIQALTEFVENYELEQVKDDEIPSAEQIKKQIQASKDRITQSYKDGIKMQLAYMAENATDTTVTDMFCVNDGSHELRTEISNNIKSDLEKLGYFVFIYTDNSETNSPYKFSILEMVISLDPQTIDIHKEREKKYGWGENIPF